MRTAFILFLLLNGCAASFAQQKSHAPYARKDTLTTAEVAEISAASRTTGFGYYRLTDSLSEHNDSIGAGNLFPRIDPYIFLCKGLSPQTIDTFISSHFKLTKRAKEQYVASFTAAFNSPKSKLYNTLKTMAEEDQSSRQMQEACMDSKCYYHAGRAMRTTDSIHFNYLYKYILKNGWPSLPDGSIYAAIIAIHDYNHYDEYFPILQKAAKEGKVDINSLESLVYWKAHGQRGMLEKHIAYSYIHGQVIPTKFVRFNIDSMLNNIMPEKVTEIKEFVRDHCPVNTVIAVECHDDKKYNEWASKEFAINRDANVLGQLYIKLAKYDCNIDHELLDAMKMGLWSVWWQPTDHEELKLVLYLKYDRDDTSGRDDALFDFNKLKTEKKFVTHAINFDVNKSVIRPESMEFMAQLAQFLKTNPSVNLEIDGHTDNDGDASANLALSLSRANEVRHKLTESGIDGKRLTTRGFGATKPLQPNSTPEAKANNRRVEFIKL